MKTLFFCCVSMLILTAAKAQERWPVTRANEWYEQQPWITGANFLPSTAVNQLEMWQQTTFDTATISRELRYAAAVGFNTMRVYLHHVAWKQDSIGFKQRINEYLTISSGLGIKTMFVFFDDCWKDQYQEGTQPAPVPGVHNSQWLKDPGGLIDQQPALMDTLERYVKDIITTFGHDDRIRIWDLYNEPGHFGHGDKSWPLLRNVVVWARSCQPVQPLTIGVYNPAFTAFNEFQIANSDIITFHNYRDTTSMIAAIDSLQQYNRPLICTEYMKRPAKSTFATHLPIMKQNKVGAINWGLVAGRSQTNYPQGNKGGEPVPELWYHDIFYPDGRAFDPQETALIQQMNTAP